MSAQLLTAARIHDPITHTAAGFGAIAGFVAGALLGIALVVAFPIAAGAFAVFCLVGAIAVAASNVGEGWASKPKKKGDIIEGSPDTFIGAPDLNAARVLDKVKCHHGERIATGARTVHINGRPAAREKEETTCDGRVGVCCETVLYGGPSSRAAQKTSSEVPRWFWWLREIIDWVTFLGPSVVGKLGKIDKLRRFLPVMTEGTQLAGWLGKLDKVLELADKAAFYVEKLSFLDNPVSKWLNDNVTGTRQWNVVTGVIGVLSGGLGIAKRRKLPLLLATPPAPRGAPPMPRANSVEIPGWGSTQVIHSSAPWTQPRKLYIPPNAGKIVVPQSAAAGWPTSKNGLLVYPNGPTVVSPLLLAPGETLSSGGIILGGFH